jgi:hypothetical protein
MVTKRGDEHRERDDEIEVLRRDEDEILAEHAPGGVALEHLVGEIEERRDVEDADQRHRGQPQDAGIRRGDVVIEDAHHAP